MIFPPLRIDKYHFLFQQKDLLVETTPDSGEKKQYAMSLKAKQIFSNYVDIVLTVFLSQFTFNVKYEKSTQKVRRKRRKLIAMTPSATVEARW